MIDQRLQLPNIQAVIPHTIGAISESHLRFPVQLLATNGQSVGRHSLARRRLRPNRQGDSFLYCDNRTGRVGAQLRRPKPRSRGVIFHCSSGIHSDSPAFRPVQGSFLGFVLPAGARSVSAPASRPGIFLPATSAILECHILNASQLNPRLARRPGAFLFHSNQTK
jgi:hypothetical protein